MEHLTSKSNKEQENREENELKKWLLDYENEEQALEALKSKSEKIYKKVVELRNLVKGKIDALNPDAKSFVVNAIIERLKAATPQRWVQNLLEGTLQGNGRAD